MALADALSQETDGNPFFLGEVLRHLDETGAVTAGLPQHSTEEQLGSLQLPESVRQVIISRVHNLGDAAREVLPMAAVVGREFDLHLLEILSQKAEGELLDVLEAAGGAALVDESPKSRAATGLRTPSSSTRCHSISASPAVPVCTARSPRC